MKKLVALFMGLMFVGAANAADIRIFYSPTCPHCHHARDFIENTLIYEYGDLKVEEINVTIRENQQGFIDALYKCGYRTGGVPVIVIGEKCFQGYADNMQPEFRSAIEVDLTADQKKSAELNRASMNSGKDAFIASHADRKNAISDKDAQKKNNN